MATLLRSTGVYIHPGRINRTSSSDDMRYYHRRVYKSHPYRENGIESRIDSSRLEEPPLTIIEFGSNILPLSGVSLEWQVYADVPVSPEEEAGEPGIDEHYLSEDSNSGNPFYDSEDSEMSI